MIIKNPIYVIGTDIQDTTATAADVLAGKVFYLPDGTKATGQIVTYTGTMNVTPIEQAQTLPTQGKYVDGDIVVDAIPSRYKDTTGTDATAEDILAGKKAVTVDGLIIGNYVPPTTTLITKNITANGTYAASSDNADGYSSVTVNVPATPAEPVPENDVTFYDYDGTVVASYTAADFANLAAMPANPTHTGLTAQGWNWTLADAKTYVAKIKKLNIGQMYDTASGKTELDIIVNEATGFTATVNVADAEKDWGDGTIDTNTSHTYLSTGNYTIKLSGTTVPKISSSLKLMAIRLSSNVQTLSNFQQNRRLLYISIPKTNMITSIPDSFAMQCYSIRSVIIPDTVTTIGKSAFARTYANQNIILPKSITSLQNEGFLENYSIEYAIIPENVASIGVRCFQMSGTLTITNRLKIVAVFATTPPTLSATNAIPSNVTKIYIPNGTLATYQGASNWSSFSSLFVELPA